jgi:hypothetical protein
MPRMINKTIRTTPPTVEPAMIPTVLALLPDEEFWPEVCEGADAVDDGELTLMHEVLDNGWTVLRGDTPPCLPCESIIKNMRFVPGSTSAIQV